MAEGIMMESLKFAIQRAARELRAEEQEWLANAIIKLLDSDDEAKWDAAFAENPEKFDRLAENALADIRAGRATLLDPDKL